MRTSKFVAFTLASLSILGMVAEAQSQLPADPTAAAISREAQWIQEMVKQKKLSAADANARLMELLQEMANLPHSAQTAPVSAVLPTDAQVGNSAATATAPAVAPMPAPATTQARAAVGGKKKSSAVAAATPNSESVPGTRETGSLGNSSSGIQPCVVVAAPSTASGSNTTYSYNVQCSAAVTP